MTKLKLRLTKEQEAALEFAQTFWESYASWNKWADDEQRKNTFIAAYLVGWERGTIPVLPSENIVPVDF